MSYPVLKVVVPPGKAARVPYYHLLMNPSGAKARFIGWVADATVGELVEDPDTRQMRPQGGWRTTDEVVELPVDAYWLEYWKAVRDGDLDPADEATAKACEVPLDRVPKKHVAELLAAKKTAAKGDEKKG